MSCRVVLAVSGGGGGSGGQSSGGRWWRFRRDGPPRFLCRNARYSVGKSAAAWWTMGPLAPWPLVALEAATLPVARALPFGQRGLAHELAPARPVVCLTAEVGEALLSRARAFRAFRGVPGWCAAPRRHRRQAGRTDPIHGYPWTPLGTDNIAPLGRGKPWSKGLVFSIKTGLDRAERAVRRSVQRSRFGRQTPNIKPPDLQAAAAAPPAIASPDRPLRVAAIGSASFHSRQAPGASPPRRVPVPALARMHANQLKRVRSHPAISCSHALFSGLAHLTGVGQAPSAPHELLQLSQVTILRGGGGQHPQRAPRCHRRATTSAWWYEVPTVGVLQAEFPDGQAFGTQLRTVLAQGCTVTAFDPSPSQFLGTRLHSSYRATWTFEWHSDGRPPQLHGQTRHRLRNGAGDLWLLAIAHGCSPGAVQRRPIVVSGQASTDPWASAHEKQATQVRLTDRPQSTLALGLSRHVDGWCAVHPFAPRFTCRLQPWPVVDEWMPTRLLSHARRRPAMGGKALLGDLAKTLRGNSVFGLIASKGEDESLHFLVMTKTTRVEARYSSCAEGITTSQCRRDGDSVAPDALEFASVADDNAGWKAMPRGSTEPARRLQRCKARERSRVDQGENIFQLRRTDSLL
ncbi:hypothetical protein Purlil1_1792 [Purpureocillium lilacinum]|uniref:Uncharacterized protein n=1 Tax=Purpureocillium lilacinum TaxID=33203 RepID=A0ABR0CBZ8_PURLI|nr:hypothetical protein Purlil1_1792 [Purpureocillium lilacinum]